MADRIQRPKSAKARSELVVFEVDEEGKVHLQDFEFPRTNRVAFGIDLTESSTQDQLRDALGSCAALRQFVWAQQANISIGGHRANSAADAMLEDDYDALAEALEWLSKEPDWEQSRHFVVPFDGLGAAYQYFRNECTEFDRLTIGMLLVPGVPSRGVDAHACLRTDVERANYLAAQKGLDCRFVIRSF